MGKIVCKSHGTQVLSFVSRFHQEKIIAAEACQEAEIIYLEVDTNGAAIKGKFLVDPYFIQEIEKNEKVLRIQSDSSSFNKIMSDLQAVCPTCLEEYLARQI